MRQRKQSFGVWLKKFKNDDSAYGDLAQDMLWDCKALNQTPRYFKTPQLLYTRMQYIGACSEAIAVLKDAATEYGQPLDIEDECDDWDY